MRARIKSTSNKRGNGGEGRGTDTQQSRRGQQTARCEKDRRLGHPLRWGSVLGQDSSASRSSCPALPDTGQPGDATVGVIVESSSCVFLRPWDGNLRSPGPCACCASFALDPIPRAS